MTGKGAGAGSSGALCVGSVADRAGCGAGDDWIACFGWLLVFVVPGCNLFTGGDELDNDSIVLSRRKAKNTALKNAKTTRQMRCSVELKPLDISPRPASTFL